MRKKLVKYGNSNALVLDRAILELLNIGEGAVVKLHTDGKSLIITPEAVRADTSVFKTGLEVAADLLEERKRQMLSAIEVDPAKKAQHNQWQPGTENFTKLQAGMREVLAKYREAIAQVDMAAWEKALEQLAAKYKDDTSSPAFIQQERALRADYFPYEAEMEKDMKAMAKELGMPEYSV